MSLAYLADLAQLLAEVFLEPDGELAEPLQELLQTCPYHGLMESLAVMAGQDLGASEQAVEYARLFLHAKDTDTVHLFESVQAQGRHLAPEVIGPLTAIYDEADISVQEELAVPPDHVGLELACLSYLLGQVIEGDPVEQSRFQELARRLLADHLRPLSKAIAAQLPLVQASPYFAAAGILTEALLDEVDGALAGS